MVCPFTLPKLLKVYSWTGNEKYSRNWGDIDLEYTGIQEKLGHVFYYELMLIHSKNGTQYVHFNSLVLLFVSIRLQCWGNCKLTKYHYWLIPEGSKNEIRMKNSIQILNIKMSWCWKKNCDFVSITGEKLRKTVSSPAYWKLLLILHYKPFMYPHKKTTKESRIMDSKLKKC